MKKILITGITGFAGSFLAEYLISQKKFEVFGTYLTESSIANLIKLKDKIHLVKLDLTDETSVSSLIKTIKPDIVINLAALTSPRESFENPSKYFYNNIILQLNILEGLRKNGITHSRVVIVSSAEIYGFVSKKDLPADEDTDLKPTSPYAVSKIAQDFLGLQYFLSYNFDVIRIRPFNHVGPRLSDSFAPSAFAKKIAEIEKKLREPLLSVGNLDAKRDFTDVRDVVVAYYLLIEKGKAGEVYNIGSGRSYKIGEILEKLLSMSKVKIKVEEDPALLRPSDIPELVCDNKKIRRLTGWSPKIPIEVSLRDTLDYWRNIL